MRSLQQSTSVLYSIKPYNINTDLRFISNDNYHQVFTKWKDKDSLLKKIKKWHGILRIANSLVFYATIEEFYGKKPTLLQTNMLRSELITTLD